MNFLYWSKRGRRSLGKLTKFVALALILSAAIGESFAQLEIRTHTQNDGGGQAMTGGNFEMRSSVGQVDAGRVLTSASYRLSGGFWQENHELIFKTGLE